MRLTMTAAALAATLLLAGCGGDDDEGDAVTQPEPTPVATTVAGVPKDDTERVCRAVQADIDVYSRKLENAAPDIAKEDPAAYADLKADLEKASTSLAGRLTSYPDADEDLAGDVQKLADLYEKAAGQLSAETAEEFVATLAQLRKVQDKVTAACG